MLPVIGITCDHNTRNVAGSLGARSETRTDRCSPDSAYRYECAPHYAAAVVTAGGIPVMLPYETGRIDDYLRLCHGFILSGGDDPDTEPFGEPVHPKAKLEHPLRQRFETELLKALDDPDRGGGGAGGGAPVLGVCLGMQMMALHHGGRLHQHLPDTPDISSAQAEGHAGNDHAIETTVADHPLLPTEGVVFSHHHQAVADAGAMRVCARSDDGLIEAIDLPGERFYLGVQWHPERTDEASLGQGLIDALVRATAHPRATH
ncbi:MAG: gamma-glutamyl-gamma-aminobutyrate hydrolase family protein [Planctomycetota bacterium]|jgi:putative glutamine amidotransferase